MKGSRDLIERSPAEVELRIEETRASLEMKIDEIERRFSPKEQMRRVRARLDPEPYLGIGAAAAVVTGAVLATVGWNRYRHADGEAPEDELTSGPRCC